MKRVMDTSETYALDFIKAVYPEMTELAMTANTEKTCLVEATKLIQDLRQKVERLQKALTHIEIYEKDGIAIVARGLSGVIP